MKSCAYPFVGFPTATMLRTSRTHLLHVEPTDSRDFARSRNPGMAVDQRYRGQARPCRVSPCRQQSLLRPTSLRVKGLPGGFFKHIRTAERFVKYGSLPVSRSSHTVSSFLILNLEDLADFVVKVEFNRFAEELGGLSPRGRSVTINPSMEGDIGNADEITSGI